jgi:hypothetical protein
MLMMLVRHKVADFERWKAVFDSHAAAQREAGIHPRHVLRSLDDPNEVFILLDVDDLDKARAFVTSPDVPGAQEASGVLDEPDLWFLA